MVLYATGENNSCSLVFEVLFLNAVFPNMIGILGIIVTITALILMVYLDKSEVKN